MWQLRLSCCSVLVEGKWRLAKNCGALASDDCCASLPVTGGSFFRGYDGVTDGDTSKAYPATVSDFRLDRYEVTVGRFRKFIGAWNGGWRPAVGAGKHTHLNGGQGLANSTGTTTYEQGWDTSFTTNVALTDVGAHSMDPDGGVARRER